MLISISAVSAADNSTCQDNGGVLAITDKDTLNLNNVENYELKDPSTDLKNKIIDADDGDSILIEPGTYKIHNITITKNLTLQGNGNPRDIIIDGENQSSIFLVRNDSVHVTFNNITFINGLTDNFGGVISMETGHVYVDNCHFINNTALSETNAGAISNYGNEKQRGYLLLKNSLFLNNHADHDGGAVTTCFADSYIYNCVFINNSARRDGGAIRVSVSGYGYVEDCIFMYNHADEWGGAYYSWSGESNINRCIFMNNTAGTNGGAVMVSGDLLLQNSIIVNNTGAETGGSFYIQQPMYDKITVITVKNNLITNNTSPYGQEIFIKWDDTNNLYTEFDKNDWGSEDPNDSSIIDPNNVTSRSKVSSTIKSKLLNTLNLDLLNKYSDLLEDYFPDNYFNNNEDNSADSNNYNNNNKQSGNSKNSNVKNEKTNSEELLNSEKLLNNENIQNTTQQDSSSTKSTENTISNNARNIGNSTSVGNKNKAYELNKSKHSVVKAIASSNMYYIILFAIIVCLCLYAGYKRELKNK